jgi:UDP-N-acetylglucosamine 2-epimerase (non-hydrolysing)
MRSHGQPPARAPRKILTLFGTRPEIIKLAPVMTQLENMRGALETVNVTSAQHKDLLYPFVSLFNVRVDYDLQIMEQNQSPNQICSRVLSSLDPILLEKKPDLILVQGDTTTAMAGALAGFHRRIPIGHVEAGLRSGNLHSPYPEEMNRTLITRLASYHFAATRHNRDTLLAEGVKPDRIFVTGNPVVDSLRTILEKASASPSLKHLLDRTRYAKRLILTTHRRESFGELMAENLRVLRKFVEKHSDVVLIFPVHPNPAVTVPANMLLAGHPRVFLIDPLNYDDFIVLLSHAWLIVSDSGGVQEEAPTLRKPLLVLRENTERPEGISSGVARLVGGSPARLDALMEKTYSDGSWLSTADAWENPFGRGDSGQRIARIVSLVVGHQTNG